MIFALYFFKVISDVFNAPVYIQKTTEAAVLGAAYRAKFGLFKSNEPSSSETYHNHLSKQLEHNLIRICEPCKDSKEIYNEMLVRYREMVAYMSTQQNE